MLLGLDAGISLAASVAICAGCGAFENFQFLWLLPLSFVGIFLLGVLAVFLFTCAACALVRLDKPQETDSRFYRGLTTLLIQAILPILGVRLEAHGLEKVPTQGRFLLVCNHLNDMDPLILLHCFPKSRLSFISKRENSSMFVVGKLMHKMRCQLINRENDREALKTILSCIQLIQDDEASIAVFPEGYTSRDHKFHGFRYGVFKIAQRAKVPIVVCTLKNTHFIFHNALRLRKTQVSLSLAAVIQPEEFAGLPTVRLGERIHEIMADSLGPEYRPDDAT